jgi:o-succinylbenzoate synthase
LPVLNMAKVTLDWVQVPLCEPFRISNGSVSLKDAIIVTYEHDGSSGYGEASPMSGQFYSAETPESTWAALETLVPAALRDPAADLDNIIEGEQFAKAGLTGAIVDHETRAAGKALWEWLGSEPREVASGVAIGIFDSVEELANRVALYVAKGYRRVKIKIQPGWDLAPVQYIRERFPQAPLMVDANAAYSLSDIPLFRELDRFGLMMYEQPLGRHALDEMAELARQVTTPVCADESAESLEMVERLIQLRAASIVNVKIQRVGGIRNAVRMHNRCMEAGVPCWVGTMPELGIASMEAVHLGTLPNFTYPTDVEASERWYVDDVTNPPVKISSRGFLAPEIVQPDAAKIERYRIRQAAFA